VHGFSTLWLNDSVVAVADPIVAIEHLALILFDG
jgi:hypothetical protein